MLKILIIDDDALTRKGIQTLMPWNAHNMEIMGKMPWNFWQITMWT